MGTKKFTPEIKDLLRHEKELRALIAVQLSIEPATVYHYVANEKDRALTKYPIVLKIIEKFTGLKESEIIEKPLKTK